MMSKTIFIPAYWNESGGVEILGKGYESESEALKVLDKAIPVKLEMILSKAYWTVSSMEEADFDVDDVWMPRVYYTYLRPFDHYELFGLYRLKVVEGDVR